MASSGGDPRLVTFWASLRPTTAPASPDTTDLDELAEVGARGRPGAASRAPRRAPPAAPAPTTASSTRAQVSRTPAADGDDEQPAEQQPGRPAEVGPERGQRLDRRGPTASTTSASPADAATRRPGRRHPPDDDEHRQPVEREAGVAQTVEPAPDDRVLPEHRPELQPRAEQHVTGEHDQRHDGDEPQRPEPRRASDPQRRRGEQGDDDGQPRARNATAGAPTRHHGTRLTTKVEHRRRRHGDPGDHEPTPARHPDRGPRRHHSTATASAHSA